MYTTISKSHDKHLYKEKKKKVTSKKQQADKRSIEFIFM